MMECTVSWTGATGARSGMGFLAETGSGHTLMMDGAPDAAKPENGGQNLAPRPMETVLAGTGGCTAYDVVLILKRGRHDVQGCSVKLTSERAEVDPKVFTKIHMHFTVTGKGIPASAVERAIAMSHDKYCSASIMLAKTAQITTSFELTPEHGFERGGLISDVVRCGGHDLGRRPHQGLDRRRQLQAPACCSAWLRARLRRPSSAPRWRVRHGLGQAGAPGGFAGALRPAVRFRPQSPGSRRSPNRPASSRGRNAPAYQSGLSSEGRAPSSSRRAWVQARWSVSSRAACRKCVRRAGLRVAAACAVYSACAQTSPT
jgi:putative redox protein